MWHSISSRREPHHTSTALQNISRGKGGERRGEERRGRNGKGEREVQVPRGEGTRGPGTWLGRFNICQAIRTYSPPVANMAPLRTKNRDNLEFATNLPDKEERKRVRRLRVERAIAAQDTDGLDTSKNDEETTSCSLSQQQVGSAGWRGGSD